MSACDHPPKMSGAHRLFLLLVLLTYLLPLGMFVAKFHQNTGNYLDFLSVSFDRAQFPTVIFLIITLALILGCSFYSHINRTQNHSRVKLLCFEPDNRHTGTTFLFTREFPFFNIR